MGGLEIALIIFAVISAVVLLFFVIGKISAGHKKISPALLKRFSKPKQDKTPASPTPQTAAGSQAAPSSAEKQENPAQTAAPEQPQFEFDQKPNKSKQPIIMDFDQLDDADKALFGLEEEKPQKPQQEEVRRKSFEEIMRNREMQRQQTQPTQFSFQNDDDDFEKFRAEHSSYTRYVKDDDLIAQIQSMSPQMKAIIFGNLFSRTNHDD